jgi:hypothetical protein
LPQTQRRAITSDASSNVVIAKKHRRISVYRNVERVKIAQPVFYEPTTGQLQVESWFEVTFKSGKKYSLIYA